MPSPRLNTFVGHLKEMGESLNKIRVAYNSGAGLLMSTVLPQDRRFLELGTMARTKQLARTSSGCSLPRRGLES